MAKRIFHNEVSVVYHKRWERLRWQSIFQKSGRCCAGSVSTNWASSCRTCMTNKQMNSSRFPMKSCRWNPGWKESFQPTQEIANQTHRFLPVGWFWRAGCIDTLGSM